MRLLILQAKLDFFCGAMCRSPTRCIAASVPCLQAQHYGSTKQATNEQDSTSTLRTSWLKQVMRPSTSAQMNYESACARHCLIQFGITWWPMCPSAFFYLLGSIPVL